jgi:hypothetical protein
MIWCMSEVHRPEPKMAVSVRLTRSQWELARRRARADDRSLGSWVAQAVRARLEELDAGERS